MRLRYFREVQYLVGMMSRIRTSCRLSVGRGTNAFPGRLIRHHDTYALFLMANSALSTHDDASNVKVEGRLHTLNGVADLCGGCSAFSRRGLGGVRPLEV